MFGVDYFFVSYIIKFVGPETTMEIILNGPELEGPKGCR